MASENVLQRVIRRAMIERGLKPSEVADRGEFPRATMYAILRRDNPKPGLKTLRGLAKGLSLPLSTLTAAADGREPDETDTLLDGEDSFETLYALWERLGIDGRRRVLWMAREHLPPSESP